MIGGVVNLAARLMQTADDVVCDIATRQAAEAKLAFEALPPRRVKGWVEPVAVFRPRGQRRTRAPSRPLVGRVHERVLLTEGLTALQHGRGGTTLIQGDAGIGKSRLLGDLVAHAAGQPVTTLVGAADAIRSTTPYHPWRPVFESLFDLTDVATPWNGTPACWIGSVAGRTWSGWHRCLVTCCPLTFPRRAHRTTSRAGARRQYPQAARRLRSETAAEEQPLLIVVEDAHWCDSASWALAWLVTQQIPRVLLVLALRPLGSPSPRIPTAPAGAWRPAAQARSPAGRRCRRARRAAAGGDLAAAAGRGCHRRARRW